MNEPELRYDAVTGRQVLFAPARALVPRTVPSARHAHAQERAERLDPPADCPFCPGNEHETHSEIWRAGGSSEPGGWTMRVFRNRFPIVTDLGIGGATGSAEVVVFSPRHELTLDEMTDCELAQVMTLFRDRMRALQESGPRPVHVYINEGGTAGASIAHAHAQIVATGYLPAAERIELEMVNRHPSDPLGDDLSEAMRRDLIVADDDGITAWCPWASPAPFLLRIAATAEGPEIVALDPAALAALGRVVKRSLQGIRRCLDDPAYNVVFYGDRRTDGGTRRWRVEVVPRLIVGGGFERATGTDINATDPRATARQLRESVR